LVHGRAMSKHGFTRFTMVIPDFEWSRVKLASLTLGHSFGHNLCFKCPNVSCETILNISVSRAFQWYKELFNPMSFDPYNGLLKIQESIETPTPKVGAHLGVRGFIPSHFPRFPGAWNVILRLHSWPAPLQAITLVASRRLGLRHLGELVCWNNQ
jgi:hypothetical protein